MSLEKANVFSRLQTDILRLQGYKPYSGEAKGLGLGPIEKAFPNATFPLGAVHEFLPAEAEDAAAMGGFVSGLLASLMGSNGTMLWISSSRILFPPALQSFGIAPDRVIFADLKKEKEVKWVMEEALKCGALAAVVGEMPAIDFTFSRRLQLAVEQSKVTGFVLRPPCLKLNPTACVSRWKISSLASEPIDELPGVGFPKWRVELLRVRNGKPGIWEVKWAEGGFQPGFQPGSQPVYDTPSLFIEQQKKWG